MLLSLLAAGLGDDPFPAVVVGQFRNKTAVQAAVPAALRERCVQLSGYTNVLVTSAFIVLSEDVTLLEISCGAGEKTEDRVGVLRFRGDVYELHVLSLGRDGPMRFVRTGTDAAGAWLDASWGTETRRLWFSASGHLIRIAASPDGPAKSSKAGGMRGDDWLTAVVRAGRHPYNMGRDRITFTATAVDDASLVRAIPRALRDRCAGVVDGWGAAVTRPQLDVVRHGVIGDGIEIVGVRCGAWQGEYPSRSPETRMSDTDERVALLRTKQRSIELMALPGRDADDELSIVEAVGGIEIKGATFAMFDVRGAHNPCCDGGDEQLVTRRMVFDRTGQVVALFVAGVDESSHQDGPFINTAAALRTSIRVVDDALVGACTIDFEMITAEHWDSPARQRSRKRVEATFTVTGELAGRWRLTCSQACALSDFRRRPLSPCEHVVDSSDPGVHRQPVSLAPDAPMPAPLLRR